MCWRSRSWPLARRRHPVRHGGIISETTTPVRRRYCPKPHFSETLPEVGHLSLLHFQSPKHLDNPVPKDKLPRGGMRTSCLRL